MTTTLIGWTAGAKFGWPALSTGGGFLELAVIFLVLAVVAAILGARGVAGVSATIAKWLVLVFLVLAVVSFFL
ncbi:DUF1328 domain-containing protein [Halobacterium sp. CBA1126]|uniref:DUF1328 domain-containing protein n=1 Tax=Halobacterium TaxID=2239 RepID=UPI0012FA7423|nr:DUF1328 family protein [Halobacterium sp. CBA1126]MUV60947.1 DUF1328 domain-containing protein [Halobacterium sp. CBA1126]